MYFYIIIGLFLYIYVHYTVHLVYLYFYKNTLLVFKPDKIVFLLSFSDINVLHAKLLAGE